MKITNKVILSALIFAALTGVSYAEDSDRINSYTSTFYIYNDSGDNYPFNYAKTCQETTKASDYNCPYGYKFKLDKTKYGIGMVVSDVTKKVASNHSLKPTISFSEEENKDCPSTSRLKLDTSIAEADGKENQCKDLLSTVVNVPFTRCGGFEVKSGKIDGSKYAGKDFNFVMEMYKVSKDNKGNVTFFVRSCNWNGGATDRSWTKPNVPHCVNFPYDCETNDSL